MEELYIDVKLVLIKLINFNELINLIRMINIYRNFFLRNYYVFGIVVCVILIFLFS